MKLTPEDFPVVTNHQLREFWKLSPDENVRRLILEVHRARGSISDVHADAPSIQYAIWDKKDGGLKTKLQKIIDRALAEKIRLGAIGGIPAKK